MLLDYRPMTAPSAEALRPFLEAFGGCGRLCDYTPGVLSMWHHIYRIRFAKTGDMLFLRLFDGEREYSAFPIAKDEQGALEVLAKDAATRGEPLHFCNVPEEKLPKVMALLPDATPSFERDWCDYLYRTEDLITLGGRRFSGQRNHLHKFTKAFGAPEFVRLTDQNVGEALSFLEKYRLLRGYADESAESEAAREALAVKALLQDGIGGQVGGILRADGEAVGFTFGELVGDTLFVHVEKADGRLPGVYQTLVNCFAKAYAHATYINREEDCGAAGLRTSKLSYHPCALLKKYTVVSPV